jgi:hypothetical protein
LVTVGAVVVTPVDVWVVTVAVVVTIVVFDVLVLLVVLPAPAVAGIHWA